MFILILSVIFLFGLSLGSFLNCVIYRLRAGKSFLRGRSFCPDCGHRLKLKDLIPVFSFLFLRGRCRYCYGKISWQYPLVELATALLIAVVYLNLSLQLPATKPLMFINFIILSIFTCFLIIIFVYDLKYYLIPDKISLPAMGVVLVLQIIVFWGVRPGDSLINLLSNLGIAVLIGGGFFWLQFVVSNGRWIGGGDIRLGVLMGLMLGWPNILISLFLAYLFGSLITLPMLALGRKKLTSRIPFGTFLTAATYITLLWGKELVGWYLRLTINI